MSDVDRACLHLSIDPQSVVKQRREGDHIVLLSDQGIAGIKKYSVPLSRLDETEPDPYPPNVQQPLDSLGYRDLQELAKMAGIAANQSADALREALSEQAVDEEE